MKSNSNSFRSAFTLVEVMVSMAIMAVILVLMARILDATGKTWASTTGKIEQFRAARQGFETITRRLSQATLNTYYDYQYPNNNYAMGPTQYIRQSELRFISGPAVGLIGDQAAPHPTHATFFQAPLGFVNDTADYGKLKTLLNTWGYWIEYVSDKDWIPSFVKSSAARSRFRLMEMMEPSESMCVYKYTSNGQASSYIGKDWFTTSALKAIDEGRPAYPLADNIVAMVLLPKLTPTDEANYGTLCVHYNYDSSSAGDLGGTNPNLNWKNQLPPVVQVTMVAVDEKSYSRICGNTLPDFGLDSRFESANGYTADMQAFQSALADKHLTYRVFTTNVSIRAAKWSRAQTN